MSAFSLGISITGTATKKLKLAPVTGPMQTSAPSVGSHVAQAEVTTNRTAGTYQSRGGGSVELSVSEWRIGTVPVGTGPEYTPTATDVGKTLHYVEQATETGGTADGSHPVSSVIVGTVLPVAPMASGALSDQTYGTDSGIQTYDVSSDFTGQDLVFSLQTAPSGVSINATGLLSVDTGVTGPLAQASIVVVAKNSGGSATSGLTLTVSYTDTVAPVITTLSAVQAAQDAPLDITITFIEVESLPITCYFVGVPKGEPAPSISQIITGNKSDNSPADIVTSFVTSVNGSETTSLSDVASDTYDLHAVAVDAAGNPSDIASVSGIVLTYSSSASHVFTDDFSSYVNGALLRDSANYNEYTNDGSRNLGIQSSTLVMDGTGVGNLGLTYEGHTFSGDHFFEATFSSAPDESREVPVLIVGWQNSGSYYAARMRNTDIDIRINDNGGGEVTLASKAFTLNGGDTVRLERSGTDLLLKVNGTTELTVTDTTFIGGKCAFRIYVSGTVNDPPTFSVWEFGEP